jgi:hypothetical protein
MNKVLFVLAVVAVALVAGEKFKPKKLPCAFELKLVQTIDKKKSDLMKITINGRYLRMKMSDDRKRGDDDMYVCYRPDITKKESGVDMIGAAVTYGGKCETAYGPLKEYLKMLDEFSETMFYGVDEIDWEHKKDTKYDGESCTVYYDDDEKDYALYVKDDYPLALHTQGYDLKFEWEWEAPMDKFKMDSCDGDFKKTPSEDYIFCAASSVKVALAALLVALVSALF